MKFDLIIYASNFVQFIVCNKLGSFRSRLRQSAPMFFFPVKYFIVQLKGCMSMVHRAIAASWGKRLKKKGVSDL